MPLSEAKSIGKEVGYPILIKAAGGGGGKGMKIVDEESQLENLFLIAKNEAKKYFGNDELYIENIAMDREGANIWLECFVNDEQMIEKEPKVKQHLDESEKKLGKLSMQLEQKRNIKK